LISKIILCDFLSLSLTSKSFNLKIKVMNKIYIYFVLLILLTSCATIHKFPVSTIEPAADITAKITKDKQNNYVISISANYMASVDRLTPPMKTYVVWIVTKENGVTNIGQMKSKNAKKNTLDTLSTFEPLEIFITAENEGNISTPSGIEISRISLNISN
jgi:hypothetical protein